jgi:hypothetical protein
MGHRKFGVLSSSADPEKLSKTVTGIIISFGALLTPLLAWVGIDIGITQLANQIGLAVGSLVFLYGVLQKVLIAIFKKVPPEMGGIV